METRYNLKSPAVKRLMKEAAELKDPTDHYHAQPLEANGRFEVGKKICLSISGHHPETWQPSWSIRTALLAIIGFMPTKGEGAIGSLDYTPEERRALAKKSQDFCCDICGSAMKISLLPLTSGSASSQADEEAKELARQISFKAEINSSRKSITESPNTSELNHSATLPELRQDGISRAFQNPTTSTMSEIQNNSTPSNQEHTQPVSNNSSMSPRQRRAQRQRRVPSSTNFNQVQQPRVNTSHTGSTVLIVLLTLALAALIFRRVYLANDYIFEL
ncbi:ubiquitin-conjugating enzyme E2 J1 isoform X3 [Chelonia mydas]|uniref:ubiquitin-conjugating enzyme E2 J1 isoform X3 n=1 Tax=Chelonia mydas TaxID=8469 RepID=UPI0018A1CA5B|nr:ubiquitin-conjugating enzyme E2 J1 isoform X3 [Chelonia mydas]